MSGHSKWRQIKYKKAATDAKRGQKFTRLAKQIQTVARSGGNDSGKNPALREAIARARQANMPQTNIDRLLGRLSDQSWQQTVYEAFGPNGIALLIIARTDNGNRTVAELRTLLKDHEGSLGQPGSVAWKFKMAPGGQYAAQYIQPVSPETKNKIAELLSQLNNHPDIEEVFTDAVIN